MTRRFCLLVVAVALSGAIEGCRGGPYVPERIDQNTSTDRARVLLVSSALRGTLQADNARVSWTSPDSRLKAELLLRNTSSKQIHVLLNSVFKDQNGNIVEEDSVWEHKLIQGYATMSYTRTALSEQAYDYTLQVKIAPVQ
ncbi:MAG: hypothetical protein ACKVX7_13040 [Planctomycetota bacterium]